MKQHFPNAMILHSIFGFEKRTCSDVTLLFLATFFVYASAIGSGSMPKNGGPCPPQSKRLAASEGLARAVARLPKLLLRSIMYRNIIFFNGPPFRYLCWILGGVKGIMIFDVGALCRRIFT